MGMRDSAEGEGGCERDERRSQGKTGMRGAGWKERKNKTRIEKPRVAFVHLDPSLVQSDSATVGQTVLHRVATASLTSQQRLCDALKPLASAPVQRRETIRSCSVRRRSRL